MPQPAAPSRTNGDIRTVTSPTSAQIKFAEMLTKLVHEGPYRTNRREIWESVGITSAALSQYLAGRTRPRLESLVDLADFFGVTTDYLLLGRETSSQVSAESRSFARYIDWALGDVQAQVGRRAWLTTRVGEILATRIDEAVEQASAAPSGGTVTTTEGLLLESASLESRILSVRLDYNIIELETGEPALGRYGHVIAANLMTAHPRPYQFLLYEQPGQDLRSASRTLRRLLREDLGVPADRMRFCEFRVTTDRVLVGSAFHRVDLAELAQRSPGLELAVSKYVTPDGWLGVVINENKESQFATLVDVDRVPALLSTFQQMWKESEVASD